MPPLDSCAACRLEREQSSLRTIRARRRRGPGADARREPGRPSAPVPRPGRKRAVGPFKTQAWNLPSEKKAEIRKAWEAQFSKLFDLLGVAGTRKFVEETIKPTVVVPDLKDYLGAEVIEEDVSDLAD